MASKKSVSTTTSIFPSRFGKRSRIRIKQPEHKDVQLRSQTVVRWEEINLEPDWFTLHKRGVRRIKVGDDPLEARAVSHDAVKGTLPERIVYKYLVSMLDMVSGIDFTFQSSQEGGRMELGGIVVDFLFPSQRAILQVQGPTHDQFLRKAKDQEQMGILEAYGYNVYEIQDDTIYDVYLFEEWMRRFFGLAEGRGGSGGAHGSYEGYLLPDREDPLWEEIYALASTLPASLENTIQIIIHR